MRTIEFGKEVTTVRPSVTKEGLVGRSRPRDAKEVNGQLTKRENRSELRLTFFLGIFESGAGHVHHLRVLVHLLLLGLRSHASRAVHIHADHQANRMTRRRLASLPGSPFCNQTNFT